MTVIITLGLIALWLALALLFYGLSRWQRRQSSLPPGRVLYSDTIQGERPHKTFVSLRYGLKGRPDYIVSAREGMIPVEIKSGLRPSTGRPYDSHLMQLASYGLLLEENFPEPVPFGVIRYRDGEVKVNFTPHLRTRLLALLDEMREARATPVVQRNHSHAWRCAGCGFRDLCDQAISAS
jgi:CRISPR-associated exonuclease Cas4